jgi:anti-sigma B factor antagonist
MPVSVAPARQFSFTREDREEATVLVCKGRLTTESSDDFKLKVKALFSAGKPVILDFSAVQQMDSSGLGAVVSLWVSAKSAQCQLQIYNLSAQVKRLLGTTHVLQAFESCGSHLTRLP